MSLRVCLIAIAKRLMLVPLVMKLRFLWFISVIIL